MNSPEVGKELDEAAAEVGHEEVGRLAAEDLGAGCGEVPHEVIRVDVVGVEGEVAAVGFP